jgi:hypothetical protein
VASAFAVRCRHVDPVALVFENLMAVLRDHFTRFAAAQAARTERGPLLPIPALALEAKLPALALEAPVHRATSGAASCQATFGLSHAATAVSHESPRTRPNERGCVGRCIRPAAPQCVSFISGVTDRARLSAEQDGAADEAEEDSLEPIERRYLQAIHACTHTHAQTHTRARAHALWCEPIGRNGAARRRLRRSSSTAC